ncbi:MAG: RNA 2',3'-cyclic phosphodiesterase [Phycisphaerae bacterium]
MSPRDTQRTFLALDIDEDVRRRLAELPDSVGDHDAKVRWVEPENLHITLNFLGDVSGETLADVCDLAAECAAGVKPFEFHVQGVLAVPPHGRKLRMLWAGVQEPTGRLADLQGKLADAMSGLGLRREDRAYRPHLTVARVKFARDPNRLRSAVAPLKDDLFGTVFCENITVYTSELGPDGPTYTAVAQPPLGK